MINHPQHFVLFAMANALFFAITFWNFSGGSPIANKILSCIFMILFIGWSVDLFNYPQDTIKYQLFFWVKSLYLLIGPLAYHFIKIKTTPNYKLSKNSLIHIAPLLIVYILSGILGFSNDKIDTLTPPLPFQLVWILYQSQTIVYVFLVFKQIKIYNEQVRNFLSNTSNYTLDWLKKSMYGLIWIWIIWILPHFISSPILYYWFYPCLILGLYIVSYFALKQNSPFESLNESSDEEIKTILNIKQNDNSAPDLQLENVKTSLINYMETQKPYLNPVLTLPKLASLLNVPPHFLSKVINKGMNENFFLFVNRYRVEESKKLLIDPNKQHYNILQIAFDSGFNSKTTFNTVFKKMTGMSPSDFQKKNS